MKWTYVIKNKLTAALLLAGVFGVSLIINLLERERFEDLEDSFSSIYEDRLMAETYLFHLYDNLNKREDLLEVAASSCLSGEMVSQLRSYSEERSGYLEKYSHTYLTENEEATFKELLSIMERTNQLESVVFNDKDEGLLVHSNWLKENHRTTEEAFVALSALSDIQTTEGTLLRAESRKIILGSLSLSQLEIGILLIIGIIIQALVFASRTTLIPDHDKPSLN